MLASPTSVRFTRTGRAYHLDIATAADLRNALDLDEALWVATSAPIDTLHLDALFLQLVDTDHDGRIKPPELKDAIRWCLEVLCDARGLDAGDEALSPAAINTRTEDGRRAHEAATRLLVDDTDETAVHVSLDHVRHVRRQIECLAVSEAGIVLPRATDDQTIRQFVEELVATVGGVTHPSGATGLDEAHLSQFLATAEAYLAWDAQGRSSDEHSSTEILPLGPATAAAFAAFVGVRDKLDQYFAQCEAAKLDDRLVDRMTGTADTSQTDFADLGDLRALLQRAPLSRPCAERTFRFDDPINPGYAEAVVRLRQDVVRPMFGNGDQLTDQQWQQTKQTLAAYEAWSSHPHGAELRPLGPEKVRHYVEARTTDAVRDLIAQSKQSAFVLDNIRVLEKLILFQANLLQLANNFISFPDLYDPARRAVFERGTAVIDGRRFTFAVAVKDRAAHVTAAATSGIYVMYLELARRGSEDRPCVAVPVTAGGQGNLCEGKRGIFEDIEGQHWDARIIQIVENPIGLGAAIAAPYRRIARMFVGKIDALTSSAEKQFDERAERTMSAVSTAGTPSAAPAEGAAPGGMAAGSMLLGGGVALAALMSALAYVGKVVVENPLGILLGVAGAILVLMLPTAIRAFLKLRQRDLSAMLEGTGWAINARMRLTQRQALTFTARPPYPTDVRRLRGMWWWIALLFGVAIAVGVVWQLSGLWVAP
jgi:hypothetical protein